MNGVQRHYETLLGAVYAWSVSGACDPFENAAAWLARFALDRGERYLDLGAGFGAHVLPLSKSGKAVAAVDLDEGLLAQLRSSLEERGLKASLHRGHLLEFLREAEGSTWDVILCLGDTLCHLQDAEEVRAFLAACARRLEPGGMVALSYRDSTELKGEGVARFREVARDSRRILHCLLEPLDAERLRVTDILTEVGAEGPTTRISDYLKIRVAPAQLAAWAEVAGLELRRDERDRGFVIQIFGRR
jgi:SAM-dependent methyltransferase